jgi:hypothetical protein
MHFGNEREVKLWMLDNQTGRRNLTDGWKFDLQQVRREILLEKGKETQGERTDILSIIDKMLPPHNTQKEVANALNWSTGKTAQARGHNQAPAALKAGIDTVYRVTVISA